MVAGGEPGAGDARTHAGDDTGDTGDDSTEDCIPRDGDNRLQAFLFPDAEARDSANGR